MKKHHWFDFVEYLSLIGVGTGTVLSIVSKQFLYSSAPMSVALLIGFANRRRVEQAQEQQLINSLSGLEQKVSKNLELVDQQMQNVPTPEMIGDVRQSILRHNRDSIKKLHAYATSIKRELENRLNSLDQQNLGETREEISQLQAQYAKLYNSLTDVSDSLRQVATTERVDEMDQAIAKLTSDTDQAQASLRTLKEYNNQTLANLQDQVNQLNRQLKSLPPHGDTSSVKREISELVRVVADLVPKRDLQAVATDLREVQQRQTAQLQIEETLRRDIQEVTQRLQSVPDVPHLRSQLEESFTQQIRTINRQLRTLYSSPELRAKIEGVLNAELGNLQALIAERLPSSPYDLVFDLSAESGDQDAAGVLGSRKALMDAIEQTQDRLILIWPWSAHTDLDGDVMRHLEWFLKQKRQLDVGWCHVSDRQHDRFLSVINRRWAINPLRQGDVQDTLKRLLALKRHYPQSFRFKVMGTAENFLISDDAFAILGLDARLQTQTFLRNADLKLRTTEQQVIQQLIRRFDEAAPAARDIDAYWNRAVTRYDLGDKGGAIADLNKILAVMPHDPAVYNLRGIIRYEQKDLAGALEDLNESIALNPDQFAVYCNRGYLHSESGDQYGAIADFSLAIQARPDSAIALFYRGAASQKLQDYEGAIADYTDALAHAPMTPVVLYQRGVVYQTVGCYLEAIADLDQAVHAFTHQGSVANARKAQEILADVRQQAKHDGVDFSTADATGREPKPPIAQDGDRPRTANKAGQETVPIDPGGNEFKAIAPTANSHESDRPDHAATPQNNVPETRQRAINSPTDEEQSLDLFGALDFTDDEDYPAKSPGIEASESTASESSSLTFDDWQKGVESFQGVELFEPASSPSLPVNAPAANSLVDHSVESIVWDMNDETSEDSRGGVDSIDTLFSDFGDEDTPALSDPSSPPPLDAPLPEDGEAARALEPKDAPPPTAQCSDLDAGSANTQLWVAESGDRATSPVEVSELETPDPARSDRKAADAEAALPETVMPSDPPESLQVHDETDTQQIGTQTLTDFFSVINAENENSGADTALFMGDECLSLPDPDRADLLRQDDYSAEEYAAEEYAAEEYAAEENNSNARPLIETPSPTLTPVVDGEPMRMPRGLDDLFSDAADHDSAESTRNGSHPIEQPTFESADIDSKVEQPDVEQSTVYQPDNDASSVHANLDDDLARTDRRAKYPDKSFQTVDEESLADFCQRFNF